MTFKINGRSIGPGKPVYVIAEPGVNHFGSVDKAKTLIRIASECGADAIKFQTIDSSEVYSDNFYPELVKIIKDTHLTKNEWLELKKFAKQLKIDFFSTPAGEKSLKLLDSIGVPCFKIGSGELNKDYLIKNVAKIGKPTILSTGMSHLSEISSLVDMLKQENCPFALLHCNSSYPSPIEDANLSIIPLLGKIFDAPIGYSDHTIGTEACLAAVALGATIIEKHFLLDIPAWDIETKMSSTPTELKTMIKQIRIIEKSIGISRKGITPSEKNSRLRMRYSISAANDISSNTIITRSILTILRPGDGISPSDIDLLIGLKIKKNIKKGQTLKWKMFK
jgi:N,N'-diacetyllegionaminate synthase